MSSGFDVITLPVPTWQVLLYLVAIFGSHRSYGNEDINSYISSYINTSQETELTASALHIERFLKAGITIYNSEVPNTAGRKTRRKRRRTKVIAKRYAFHANVKKTMFYVCTIACFLAVHLKVGLLPSKKNCFIWFN